MGEAATLIEEPRKPAAAAGREHNPLRGNEAVWEAIAVLDLQEHVVELDVKGFTIVPPEKVFEHGFAQRLLETSVRIAEAESGITPDFETGRTHSNIDSHRREKGNSLFPFQEEHGNVVFKDPIFEQFVVNPTILALVTYLLGEHAVLSNAGGVWFRGPVAADLAPDFVPPTLHCDNYGVPSPFPAYAQLCNATIPLTNYTREGGCLGFVPGSHLLMRHPVATTEHLDKWVPAEAEAGSLILWHGNTWHTIGNPRVIPGLRVNMTVLYCRPHMLPMNWYRPWVTQEQLDRNPESFARLMGMFQRFGNNQDPRSPRSRAPQHDADAGGVPPAPGIFG